jgi:hypothetical protein
MWTAVQSTQLNPLNNLIDPGNPKIVPSVIYNTVIKGDSDQVIPSPRTIHDAYATWNLRQCNLKNAQLFYFSVMML